MKLPNNSEVFAFGVYKSAYSNEWNLLYTSITSNQGDRMKKIPSVLILCILIVSLLTAAAPVPNTTFTLVQGLPEVMNVGDTYTVIVQVESDQPYLFAQALPSFEYVGKGMVAVQGGDHARDGTSATLEITYLAKSSTAQMPGGMAPVYAVAAVRYPGGFVVSEQYVFYVTVP
jgi:hypothetical protein